MGVEINICLFSLLWVILIIKFIKYALYIRYRHPNNIEKGKKCLTQ